MHAHIIPFACGDFTSDDGDKPAQFSSTQFADESLSRRIIELNYTGCKQHTMRFSRAALELALISLAISKAQVRPFNAIPQSTPAGILELRANGVKSLPSKKCRRNAVPGTHPNLV
jgi:hypothetical protein